MSLVDDQERERLMLRLRSRLLASGWVVDARVVSLMGDVVSAVVAEMRESKDDPNESRRAWLEEAADWLECVPPVNSEGP